MKYDVAVLTDVGLVRTNNEDAYLIDRELDLFILADGMGGYQKGEVASLMTCEGIAEYLKGLAKNNITDFSKDDLKKAVLKANSNIRKKINDIPGLDRMGSTVVTLLLKKDRIYIANVGDSRAYLFRKGKFEQISIDHSLVQETKAAGIKRELANQFKNIVTRAMGMKDTVEPDVFTLTAKAGDKFLLCSDGLHGFVSDKKIQAILATDEDIGTQISHMIQSAKEGGGKDNITGIILHILEDQNQNSNFTEAINVKVGSDPNSDSTEGTFYIKMFLIFLLFIVCLIIVIMVI